ncbi:MULTISPECIES: dethiobiotin synthase [unclassified Luteococcus]|uniref:dethiobiotin synthase n=1 Tax=unclassified Luteococcus TaxID=2639923 RepID=UPI00313DCAF4
MILVITGTNTDVGKTIATAALAVVLEAAGWEVLPVKPVQTGEPDGHGDAPTVTRLTGLTAIDRHRYPEPLAPNLSARRAGMAQPVLADVVRWLRGLDAPGRAVLVEGAGGLLVRIADDWTLADLARELGAPLVLVTSTGLGSLNLAELTVEAARRRGLDVLGVVGGSLPSEPDLATRLNLAELPDITGVPLWGSLPEGAGGLAREEFAAMARGCLSPGIAAPPA